MFSDLYNTVRLRYGQGSGSMTMGEWICANTTLKRRPFSFEHYEFQKAIADDMHPNLYVKKISQVGLALDLNTPVPTPTGWTTMGAIRVGDTLFDENGKPCVVTYVSPVYRDRKCYELEFDDGEIVVADENHRWFVESYRAFKGEEIHTGRGRPTKGAGFSKSGVTTTRCIAENLHHQGRNCFAIPNALPLSLARVELPLDPYFLGCWLGDGNTHAAVLTAHRQDAPHLIAALGRRGLFCHHSSEKGDTVQFTVKHPGQRRPGRGKPVSVSNDLTELGLLGSQKFVPAQYLRASREQRLELLRGLMDTDGSVTKRGRCSFYNTNPYLVEAVLELARSLGLKPRVRWRAPTPGQLPNGHQINSKLDCAEVHFVAYAEDGVFELPRKRERLKPRAAGRATESYRRRVVAARQIESVPVRCLTVDSPSHLFLAGRGMIPTHNTEVQIRKFLGVLTRNTAVAGIFTMPTEKMYIKTYNSRIKPILDADVVFNPPGETQPVRRSSQIQIRDSFGYITGCTEGDATSTPADFLMHDELDLSPEDMIALYQSRLQNSTMRMTQNFSTPTYETFGIDRGYALSDQREYVIKCSACNHHQIPLFNPVSVFIPNFRIDVSDFADLTAEQIATLNTQESYVRCDKCSKPLDLGNPEIREWVARHPSRENFRGYQIRPFSTSRLNPHYVFQQLARYQGLGFIRGWYNTVLGEAYTNAAAKIQRGDIEKCMLGPKTPEVPSGRKVFLGVDVGFLCHLTLSFDDDDGNPVLFYFEAVPIGALEDRVRDLRKVYNIVQGCVDRFPFEPNADALRTVTNNLVMPVQYRGTAALAPVKDELGEITHYSANRTYILDRVQSYVQHHKLVLTGYGDQKETLITHLTDNVRDESPDFVATWKKSPVGNDHYFHSIALNLLARRVNEHSYAQNTEVIRYSTTCLIATAKDQALNISTPGAQRISRLGK